MRESNPFGIEERKEQFHEQSIYSMVLLYNSIHSQMTSFLKTYHLTPGKFNILMVIQHRGSDQGIKQVDISKHLIVTPSNMTKLIDKLEQDQLVQRLAQEGDRRVNLIVITQKGVDLLDEIWNKYCAQLKQMSGELSTAEHRQLAKLLTKWLRTFSGGK